MSTFKKWIFYIPIIGEVYLIGYIVEHGEFPDCINAAGSGFYQGFWVSLLILLMLAW